MIAASDSSTATALSASYEIDGERIRKRLRSPGGEVITSRVLASPLADDDDLEGAWLRSFLRGKPISLESPRSPSVRTVELFCGPGGLALGFDQAARELGSRLESEAAIDQDAEAVTVYAANHRTKLSVPHSATELAASKISGVADSAHYVRSPILTLERSLEDRWQALVGQVDAVIAGPPCQGHSNLNNHSRRTDTRNELYFTVPEVAVALGADIVVIENVPAVVHDRSQVVATTERLLRDSGYDVTSGVLYAEKMGWPQTRRRFFMVGRRSVPPVPIGEVRASLEGRPLRSVSWAISDLESAPFDDRLHIDTELSADNQRRIEYLFEHGLYDLPLSERPECHKDGTTYNSVYGRLFPDRPAPTITTGFLTPGRGRYIHPTQRRTLTPREAARLQGFPDNYNFFPSPRNPPTKLKLTKWIGDAVPMPLGYAAGLSALGNGWSR
jgi:DNA (cytosine-5)-methyltransferase 1